MNITIEVKNGSIEKICDAWDTKTLAAVFAATVPEVWPSKGDDCHIALKRAITGKQDHDWYADNILTKGYKCSIADGQQPATREYVAELINQVSNLYYKWRELVVVPEVLPDGTYGIKTLLVSKRR